jgi:hypothetical protein
MLPMTGSPSTSPPRAEALNPLTSSQSTNMTMDSLDPVRTALIAIDALRLMAATVGVVLGNDEIIAALGGARP